MPSSYTSRLRLELQAPGEGLNVWGVRLNTAVGFLEFAVAGWTTKALTGNYTLTSSNNTDEARAAVLKFTGAGPYTVTIPAVEKTYKVWNATSATLTVTTGAGTAVTIPTGNTVDLICDAANVRKVQPTDFDGLKITSVGAPTISTDAATKGYVDTLVSNTTFAMAAGQLPMQTGNAGKVLGTDGSVAGWVDANDATARAEIARQQARRRLLFKELL